MNIGLAVEFSEFKFLRYLIYSPAILVILSLFRNKFVLRSFNSKINSINFSFLLIIISGLLHLPILGFSGFSQIFFISIASLPFIINNDFKFNVRYVSLIFMMSFLILSLYSGFSIDFSLLSFLKSETSSLETNQHPFVFGIMALFFLYKRDNLFFILNLIFVIISFKRIVFIGLLFAIPIVLLERKNIIILRNKRWFFLVLNLFYVYIIILFTNGVFNELIEQYTGLSTGHLTQGRNNIFSPIVDQYIDMGIFEKLFGMGQGFTYDLSIYESANAPHNDILTILIDHGIFIFILFFYYSYQEVRLFPVIFTNFLFLTDNTMIYTVYIFVLLLLINNLNQSRILISKKLYVKS
mgnify:FL=1|tara:strand:- start:12356 stop:13414 length:1059 start_codon:yes stop_codon:yes gene_type:complete